jgi:hypothetical protein
LDIERCRKTVKQPGIHARHQISLEKEEKMKKKNYLRFSFPSSLVRGHLDIGRCGETVEWPSIYAQHQISLEKKEKKKKQGKKGNTYVFVFLAALFLAVLSSRAAVRL